VASDSRNIVSKVSRRDNPENPFCLKRGSTLRFFMASQKRTALSPVSPQVWFSLLQQIPDVGLYPWRAISLAAELTVSCPSPPLAI